MTFAPPSAEAFPDPRNLRSSEEILRPAVVLPGTPPASPRVRCVYEDQMLQEAMEQMAEYDTPLLLVLSRRGRVLGTLTALDGTRKPRALVGMSLACGELLRWPEVESLHHRRG